MLSAKEFLEKILSYLSSQAFCYQKLGCWQKLVYAIWEAATLLFGKPVNILSLKVFCLH